MTEGKLTKLSDNENALRTKFVDGEFQEEPSVGMPFTIYSKAIDPAIDALGGFRMVQTSLVKEVEATSHGYEFNTENSRYALNVY